MLDSGFSEIDFGDDVVHAIISNFNAISSKLFLFSIPKNVKQFSSVNFILNWSSRLMHSLLVA